MLDVQVVMEFRHPDSEVKVPVFLARRSLLIMTGESRYLWTHGYDSFTSHISCVQTLKGNMPTVTDWYFVSIIVAVLLPERPTLFIPRC